MASALRFTAALTWDGAPEAEFDRRVDGAAAADAFDSREESVSATIATSVGVASALVLHAVDHPLRINWGGVVANYPVINPGGVFALIDGAISISANRMTLQSLSTLGTVVRGSAIGTIA